MSKYPLSNTSVTSRLTASHEQLSAVHSEGGAFTSIQRAIVQYRLPLILALNLFLTALSYSLSLLLRFDSDFEEVLRPERLIFPLTLLFLFRTSSYLYWSLNQGYWRYFSTTDILQLIKAHAFSTLCLAAAVVLFRVPSFPRSVLFIELTLSIVICGGSRLAVRLMCERLLSDADGASLGLAREVVILGAGASGHLIVKNLLSQPRLLSSPVAIFDDSERAQGATVIGVPVVGPLRSLGAFLDQHRRVSAVINAIPSLSVEKRESIERACASVGVPLKRLQSFEDIACVDASQPQTPLSIESVLEKETTIEHEQEIRDQLVGRRILITGAGGSIGSEIVRQVLRFEPERVILLENGEFNLFKLEREVRTILPKISKRAVVASITDERRLLRCFDEERPHVVFHAAAYKHVPLMEDNCYEAFVNNVVGTRNVLRVSRQVGVEHIVMISTDKAVDPSSVMGCSKRIAEALVQSYAESGGLAASSSGMPSRMGVGVVRFGNVINSNGSVIPLFREQILSGGPLTVTHPEMERYFMSIREAVRLVLTAGTLGECGEIYILDMGQPIKILEVAKKMLALYGRRDIPIVFTGMRPGEKLSESLTNVGEDRGPTRFKGVWRALSSLRTPYDVRRWVSDIEHRIGDMSDAEIGAAMREFVVAHQPSQATPLGSKVLSRAVA